MKRSRFLLALGLLACGCVGDGIGTAAASKAPSLAIAPANMGAVAAMGTTLVSMNLPFHSGGEAPPSLPGGTPANLTGLSLALFTRLLGDGHPGPGLPARFSRHCANGGTLRFDIQRRQSAPRPLQAGERLVVRLDGCDEFGTAMDGTVTYRLERYRGDLNDTGRARLRLDYHGLGFATLAGRTRVDGRARAYIDTAASTTRVDFRAERLDYRVERRDSVGRLKISRQRLRFTIDHEASTVTTLANDAHFRFPALAGRLSVSTPRALIASADGAIRAGTVALRGARSTLYLSYPEPSVIRLDLDCGNNGTIDASHSASPTELEARPWR
ncbi:hypothetical protein [Zoogloea sp.]|uniref:hypothetical protein n=1 Tax=Zoogloea sp. TaxID=49181 RepID=UPI0035AE90E1